MGSVGAQGDQSAHTYKTRHVLYLFEHEQEVYTLDLRYTSIGHMYCLVHCCCCCGGGMILGTMGRGVSYTYDDTSTNHTSPRSLGLAETENGVSIQLSRVHDIYHRRLNFGGRSIFARFFRFIGPYFYFFTFQNFKISHFFKTFVRSTSYSTSVSSSLQSLDLLSSLWMFGVFVRILRKSEKHTVFFLRF